MPPPVPTTPGGSPAGIATTLRDAPTCLAAAIGVPPRRINEIVHGKRGITAGMAVRLARYFGTSAEFWMNLQMHYELRSERRALRDQLERIKPLEPVA